MTEQEEEKELLESVILESRELCAQLPVELTLCDFDTVLSEKKLGAYCFRDDNKYILIYTPGGLSRLNIGEDKRPRWNMSVNNDRITLNPSILVSTSISGKPVELFHGWVRNGMLVNC